MRRILRGKVGCFFLPAAAITLSALACRGAVSSELKVSLGDTQLATGPVNTEALQGFYVATRFGAAVFAEGTHRDLEGVHIGGIDTRRDDMVQGELTDTTDLEVFASAGKWKLPGGETETPSGGESPEG